VAGFHEETSATDSLPALGKAGSINNGKLDQGQGSTGTSPPCPECGSAKAWKDGIRETAFGPVQRYLCRNCAYRFSDPNSKQLQRFFNGSGMSEHVERIHTKKLKSETAILTYCRVSDEPIKRASTGQLRLVKSLAEVETRNQERAAGATKLDVAITKGKLLEYAWLLKKRGLSESTMRDRLYRLTTLTEKGSDLMNPDSVETVLATESLTASNKHGFVAAYKSFTKTFNIPWIPIKVRYEPKQPFIPLETELDQLIAACGKRTAAFLQTLKDTAARAGEICKLKWTDINEQNNTISINNPEKGSKSRTVKVTAKTIAMLKRVSKKYGDYIFNPKRQAIYDSFARKRNQLADKLQNPRLKQIHFHTFRHWKATVEYQKTRNILHVKYLLGHKRLENTEIYTHLIEFENDEYNVATAKNVEEAKQLIESGFEYVTDMEGIKLFRKRK